MILLQSNFVIDIFWKQKLETQFEQVIKENQLLKHRILTLESDNSVFHAEAQTSLASLAEKESTIHSDLITSQKRLEVAQSEISRLELSYSRVLEEKERLQGTTSQAVVEAARFRDQVEELLKVNAKLKSRSDDLQKTHAELQLKLEDQAATLTSLDIDQFKTRIKELQQDKINLQTEVKQTESIRSQQEQLHKRLCEDYNELMKTNVTVTAELEEIRRRFKSVRQRVFFAPKCSCLNKFMPTGG